MAYRLLVVPGDSETLRALQNQLTDNVVVQILESANDALWEVRNDAPQAIVANLDLPGMSGLDLADILPNFDLATKVVLWSDGPSSEAAQITSNPGVFRFLNGPISDSELHDVIFEALREGDVPMPVEEEVADEFSADPISSAPESTTSPATETPEPKQEPVREPEPEVVPERRTRRERAAAAAAAAAARQMAAASKPAAAPPPPPEPAPQAAPAKAAPRRRDGPLILTADNLTPIRNRLDALWQDVGAQCILLADRAGIVLAEVGITAGLPTMILLPMLSTTFSTAGQIAQMLREDDSASLFMHEGLHYDLYCFDVLQRFMLVIVFDKAASAAKIGSVWVYAKRAIRDIQEVLA
jgi:DNA-binding NarL/FixJ family response regulator/predicted regulator of Ras-like GTPase activity (Roadblock/LC7/MglB family)